MREAGDHFCTVPKRGGNPGEKTVREMLQEQAVLEGKDDQCECGSGTPLGFRSIRKELTLGGNKGEGRREDAEGGSILAPLQGQVLLSGILRRPPAMPDLYSFRA